MCCLYLSMKWPRRTNLVSIKFAKTHKKRLIRKVGEQVSAFNTNVVRVELARVCLNFSPLPTEKKDLYFVHPIFGFRFLVTFGSKVTKIQKYYLIFRTVFVSYSFVIVTVIVPAPCSAVLTLSLHEPAIKSSTHCRALLITLWTWNTYIVSSRYTV